MKAALLLTFTVFLSAASALADPHPRKCARALPGELPVLTERVTDQLGEQRSQFLALYESGRRLAKRAHWDEEKKSFVATFRGEEIRIPDRFLANLAQQVETALARGYADFLFYPDMGHGHLLVREADLIKWKEAHSQEPGRLMEQILESAETKILYHSAELLLLRGRNFKGPLPQDLWLSWRYFSRNFLGDNSGKNSLEVLFAKGERYNTVREIPGYREWVTFRISSSKDGCFSYSQGGEQRHFDIALEL